MAEMAETPAEMVETVEVAEAESPTESPAEVENPPDKRVAWDEDDGQEAPEKKISRTLSRSLSRAGSSANLAAKKGVKFSWSFVREIVFYEVLFRQLPMAYFVTVPAFLCMFVVTLLIQPSRQFEAEIPPGNTTLSVYVSWIPFGRDEIHQTAYGHFEWYVIYEVVGKALQLAMATWVLARLMLGKEKFWQQSWRWEALGFAFFVGVMAAVNVCGAVVGHSQVSTECVPVPYPFIAPASSFPCFVIFSLKMKRILGDHQFATLAMAILCQVFVLSTEYIVFVRNASMWPDSDFVIFIYKYTLQPFLWTFVIFPVAPRYSLFCWGGNGFLDVFSHTNTHFEILCQGDLKKNPGAAHPALPGPPHGSETGARLHFLHHALCGEQDLVVYLQGSRHLRDCSSHGSTGLHGTDHSGPTDWRFSPDSHRKTSVFF